MSSRKSCTTRLTLEMQGRPGPTPQAIRSQRELLASAPTADKLAISRPTRSMQFSCPDDYPPRIPFDWWCVPDPEQEKPRNRVRKAYPVIAAINKAMKAKDNASRLKVRTEQYRRNPAARLPFDWWGVGNLTSSHETTRTISISRQQRRSHPAIQSIVKAIKDNKRKANEELRRTQQLARQQAMASESGRTAADRRYPHATSHRRRLLHSKQQRGRPRNTDSRFHTTPRDPSHIGSRRRRQEEAEAQAIINRFPKELFTSSQQTATTTDQAREARKNQRIREEKRRAIVAHARPQGQTLTKSKYFS